MYQHLLSRFPTTIPIAACDPSRGAAAFSFHYSRFISADLLRRAQEGNQGARRGVSTFFRPLAQQRGSLPPLPLSRGRGAGA